MNEGSLHDVCYKAGYKKDTINLILTIDGTTPLIIIVYVMLKLCVRLGRTGFLGIVERPVIDIDIDCPAAG